MASIVNKYDHQDTLLNDQKILSDSDSNSLISKNKLTWFSMLNNSNNEKSYHTQACLRAIYKTSSNDIEMNIKSNNLKLNISNITLNLVVNDGRLKNVVTSLSSAVKVSNPTLVQKCLKNESPRVRGRNILIHFLHSLAHEAIHFGVTSTLGSFFNIQNAVTERLTDILSHPWFFRALPSPS